MAKQQLRINDIRFPQVVVSTLPFLDDEFQIKQGTERGVETDMGYTGLGKNDVISLSRTQAVALAKAILEFDKNI